MTESQLAVLIDELNNIALELLDISIDLSQRDAETGIRVSNANSKLLQVNMVLTEHLDKQKAES